MKRLLSLSLFLMTAMLSFAYDFEAKNADGKTIYYKITSSSDLTVAVTYKGTPSRQYSNEYTGDVTIPESVSYGGKTYCVTSIGNYAFKGCSGLTSINIPNSVTRIGDDAFWNCSGLKKVIVPDIAAWCIIYLGDNPLSYAKHIYSDENTEIKDLVIPNSVTSIGHSTFSGCSGLTSITIPNSVTSIGSYAFYNCSGLTSITIPNSVTSIGDNAFSGCGNSVSVEINSNAILSKSYTSSSSLVNIFGDQVQNYIIDNDVTTIGSYAFYGCSGLTSITIPHSVTSIGSSAFDGCTGLTSVTIPNSVTSISGHTFYNTRLKSVTIGAGVLSISSDAFSYSDSSTGAKPVKVIWLTNTPPSGYERVGGKVNYVANDLYKGLSNMTVYPFLSSMFEAGGVKYVPVSPSERTCDAIDCTYDAAAENINIGKTVSYKGIAMTVNNIKPYTCYQNPFIKSADVSYNGSIGDYVFSGNISLEKAILGDKVTSLGDYVFNGCSRLQSIDIPNGITQMGSYAFRNCSNMTSAKIGTGVTAINEYTFSGCSALKDVQIGSNVKTIGNYVFSGCTSLPVINIPKAVTSIGNYTFSGCTALREVVMEDRADDTVLSLGSNGSSPMFASCPLDKVYIGRNISYNKTSNYGYSPFYRNTSLRSVTITDRETEVSENEFYGCTNLKEVKIGDGVTTIGSWAFSGCAAIDYFAFGSSVKTIGQEAFSDCTAMTRLISRAATPPSCGSQALDDINKWTCTLSVPAGSTSAYQKAAQWKEFFFIDNDMTGIEAVAAEGVSNADITDIYDLNGRRRDALQPGINIVKMSDGTTKKVVAK